MCVVALVEGDSHRSTRDWAKGFGSYPGHPSIMTFFGSEARHHQHGFAFSTNFSALLGENAKNGRRRSSNFGTSGLIHGFGWFRRGFVRVSGLSA